MTAAAAELRLALLGVPNSGKTALFNRLTGGHQKVANYAGVTVERKEGRFTGTRSGRGYRDHEYLLLMVRRATATRRRQAA